VLASFVKTEGSEGTMLGVLVRSWGGESHYIENIVRWRMGMIFLDPKKEMEHSTNLFAMPLFSH